MNDLPNENGILNHTDGAPGCTGNACPDNHDTLTGSTSAGALMGTGTASTCADWTSAAATSGRPGLGHSLARQQRDELDAGAHAPPGARPAFRSRSRGDRPPAPPASATAAATAASTASR